MIPQLKDRIGSVIHTHYPRERDLGIQIMEQEAGVDLGRRVSRSSSPTSCGRSRGDHASSPARSKYVDHQSGVSARFSIANYRTMVASARHRGVRLGERPAVPRISDLGHLYASSLGKLELDMMGSHQMSERQVLDAVLAEAIRNVFERIRRPAWPGGNRADFRRGSEDRGRRHAALGHYAERLKRVPPVWDKAFEVNASSDPAVRASCVEFVLAGLYATDRISRSQQRGRIIYELWSEQSL